MKVGNWECVNGKCKECGIEKKLKISECPILNTCTESIPCMEWKFVARRGKKKWKRQHAAGVDQNLCTCE